MFCNWWLWYILPTYYFELFPYSTDGFSIMKLFIGYLLVLLHLTQLMLVSWWNSPSQFEYKTGHGFSLETHSPDYWLGKQLCFLVNNCDATSINGTSCLFLSVMNVSDYIFFVPQVLDRGERIELLVDKTENLQFQVHDRFFSCLLVEKLSCTNLWTCTNNVLSLGAPWLL